MATSRKPKLSFERDDSPWGFKPHRYKCPLCGGYRVIHISDMARPYATKGWVCHLSFKCVNCFSTVTHSIPITEEYRDELIRRRGGIQTYAPWSEEYQNDPSFIKDFTPEEQKEIKRRLKALGYF